MMAALMSEPGQGGAWALVGLALMGRLGPHGPGHNEPPWALMGRALMTIRACPMRAQGNPLGRGPRGPIQARPVRAQGGATRAQPMEAQGVPVGSGP